MNRTPHPYTTLHYIVVHYIALRYYSEYLLHGEIEIEHAHFFTELVNLVYCSK